MFIQIELTDTFDGVANYRWVRWYRLEHKPDETSRALIRRVKQALGWSGIRCQVSNLNYMIDIRPTGRACVAFVTWEE